MPGLVIITTKRFTRNSGKLLVSPITHCAAQKKLRLPTAIVCKAMDYLANTHIEQLDL